MPNIPSLGMTNRLNPGRVLMLYTEHCVVTDADSIGTSKKNPD